MMAGYTEQMLALYKLREARYLRNEISKLDIETVLGELSLKCLSNEGSPEVLRERLVRAGLRTMDKGFEVPWFAEVDEIAVGEPMGREDELREMLENHFSLISKGKCSKKTSGESTGMEGDDKEGKIVPICSASLPTIPATSFLTTFASSGATTSITNTLAGAVSSPSSNPQVPLPNTIPSAKLLQKQWQDAQGKMNNDRVLAETRKRVEVTSTDFESSSSEGEQKGKSKLSMEKHSRLDDLVRQLPKSGAASLPKDKKEMVNDKRLLTKVKLVKEKVKNRGANMNADKVRKSNKTDNVKREKDGKKKTGKHAAKERRKAHVSNSESDSSSESSDSSEDERSSKKKKKRTSKEKKPRESSSSESSEISSSSSSSSM